MFVSSSLPRVRKLADVCRRTINIKETQKHEKSLIFQCPYFKRFSGIEKVHRNSIKITVDLCQEAAKKMPLKREKENLIKEEAPIRVCASRHSTGGVGETRTLAPGFSRPTPLAGAPRHQLEYYSELLYVFTKLWRRGWDSNPCAFWANGFQDRLVMTASIPLRDFATLLFYHNQVYMSIIFFTFLIFPHIRIKDVC